MATGIEHKNWLLVLGASFLLTGQTPGWKARVGSENGVKVVANPSSAALGEFRFELAEDLVLAGGAEKNLSFGRVWDVKADDQDNIFVLDSGNQRILEFDRAGKYLRTIGRQGQGPGEFETPVGLRFDQNGFLYVLEMRKIHVFASDGGYVRTINTPSFLMDFVPDGKGNAFISGYVRTETGQDFSVLLVDSKGATVRTIARFPGLSFGRGGTTLSHDYSPDLRVCGMGKGGFVYGYSPQYKLYCADWSGQSALIITKDEPFQSVSRKEKDKIIGDYLKITSKGGFGWSKDEVERVADIPRNRPFFRGIVTDNVGRIYVKRVRSVLKEGEETDYDIFSRDGEFLYAARLPFTPLDIRDGYLYSTTESAETGEVRVIRHEIKNWRKLQSSVTR